MKRKEGPASDSAENPVAKKIKVEDSNGYNSAASPSSTSSVETVINTISPQMPQFLPPFQTNLERQRCWHWLRDGTCKFGGKCRFTHY